MITPFLWFDNKAEEAANFYVSIFPDSKVLSVSGYGDGAPMPSRLLQSEDAGKSQRVMKAMLQMKKIDIRALEEA